MLPYREVRDANNCQLIKEVEILPRAPVEVTIVIPEELPIGNSTRLMVTTNLLLILSLGTGTKKKISIVPLVLHLPSNLYDLVDALL